MTIKNLVKISPSLLAADFANLEREIKALEQAGADLIHLDVMDGHFVPNLTFGPMLIKALRKYTKLPFDVHLMIENPENHLEAYAKAGADIITIHSEATIHLDKLLEQIAKLGVMPGLALLPSSSPAIVDYLLDKLKLILVMSVNPGFGGQKFIPAQLGKIRAIAAKLQANKKDDILLAVDGGINAETGAQCLEAGANILIAGSFIFNGDYKNNITKLRQQIA